MPSGISNSVPRESPHRVRLPEPDTARGIHQLRKMDRAAADEPTDFANSAKRRFQRIRLAILGSATRVVEIDTIRTSAKAHRTHNFIRTVLQSLRTWDRPLVSET